MSSYILLYDTKRKISVRTTSNEIAQDLMKNEKTLVEVAWVGGRDCKVSDGLSTKNYNAPEYKKIVMEEKDQAFKKFAKGIPLKNEIFIQGE